MTIQEEKPVAPPLAGYLDRLSARPGERIAVKASSEMAGEVGAHVVRIWNADSNPDGLGIQTERIQGMDLGKFRARTQTVALGSWGWVPTNGLFRDSVVCISLHYQPWLTCEKGGTLLSLGEPGKAPTWTLGLTPDGLELKDNGISALTALIKPKRKRWYEVLLRFDMRTGRVDLAAKSLCESQTTTAESQIEWSATAAARLFFAAEPTADAIGKHFNGRLEDITVRAESPQGPIRAFWDFSIAMHGVSIIDCGPRSLHGQLVNLPTRGVRGARWDGSEQSYLHAPRQYAAIHFHEDDLYDCEWQTDVEFEVPSDLPSGVYGVKLEQDGVEDIIPFYVLAPKGRPTSRICYLASTFTYLAYANHARGNLDEAMEARIREWGAPRGPDNYPAFGFSTYNFHPDGSGTSFSSRLRPLLTMRPGFLTFAHGSSGLRHFPADGHLVEWFRQKRLEVDVITDEDLHREGLEAIAKYDVVITGSHPEYHTTQTLTALREYTSGGGNFIYLGGNGFYWRIAVSDTVPGVLEVRRAEGGIRAWATEPGEGYQVLDGHYGGLWRRNGHPPQEVGCVGFSAQGLFEGSYYKRTNASFESDVAWIFEGVEEDPLGNYGFSGGGAAGFELDRADFELGTPEGTIVLARSTGHGPSFIPVPEELLSHLATVSGEPARDLIRAEIVYSKLPSGGEVFATGSITFCGSLPWNNFENGVSRMLENVVRRFGGLDE